jgi:hypothetical protein
MLLTQLSRATSFPGEHKDQAQSHIGPLIVDRGQGLRQIVETVAERGENDQNLGV